MCCVFFAGPPHCHGVSPGPLKGAGPPLQDFERDRAVPYYHPHGHPRTPPRHENPTHHDLVPIVNQIHPDSLMVLEKR